MIRILLVLLLAASPSLAQTGNKPDVWEPFRYFIGAWEGTSKGQFGEGTVEREYKFALNGAFIEVKNKSVYKPQEKNKTGEVHEDAGFISYDRLKKKYVFRQFHIEGFVNQYALDKPAAVSKAYGFQSESIENIPDGWRAKETYKIISNDEFVEVFELAAPGKDFEVYVENRFKRKR